MEKDFEGKTVVIVLGKEDATAHGGHLIKRIDILHWKSF